MQSKRTKNIMVIITYTAILILLIINFSPIARFFGDFLKLFNSFFVGIALAFILNTPCMAIERFIKKHSKIEKKSILRGISVVITYVLFLLVIILLIWFVIPQLFQSVQGLVSNLGMYFSNFQTLLNNITGLLEIDAVDLSDFSTFISSSLEKLMTSITDITTSIIDITTNLISAVINLFVSIIFSIYILTGKEKLINSCKRILKTYLSGKVYDGIYYVYHIVVDIFNNYIIGQFTEAIILGVLCFIGMVIFRFDYPLLISVIISVLALIPVVGAYLGGFIGFFILLLISPIKAFWFILFLVILQQFEGNVIYPRVVGSSVGLPAIWVLLSITVGGGIAGPIGILLAVPITSVFYTLLKNDINRRNELVEATQDTENIETEQSK